MPEGGPIHLTYAASHLSNEVMDSREISPVSRVQIFHFVGICGNPGNWRVKPLVWGRKKIEEKVLTTRGCGG
jgi:hypothetical protein